MKLSSKIGYLLTFLATLVVGGLLFATDPSRIQSLAYSDSTPADARDYYYVTVYDNGKKTVVKTGASTVEQILDKMHVVRSIDDIVEPKPDTEINTDASIRIRHSYPALVTDGYTNKYIRTASSDPKLIAMEAGFIIYNCDQISTIENDHFLETGAAAAYKIDHSTCTNSLDYSVLAITSRWAGDTARNTLNSTMGRNRYLVTKADGSVVERQETYYDLNMNGVMSLAKNWSGCSHSGTYTVREDGVKVDEDGYILVAAELNRYPRCSIVDTSLGLGKVYDTGTFAQTNPEQFDIATDWTNRNGT